MKITSKDTMRKLENYSFIINNSKDDLIVKINEFEVPKKIIFIPVAHKYSICLGDLMDIWDVSDNNELMDLTVKVFLKDTLWKRFLYALFVGSVKRLPLIDFMRLITYTNEISIESANMFKSLHREPESPKEKAIYLQHKAGRMDMIDRFIARYPAYTIEQVLKLSWLTVYYAFESETNTNDTRIKLAKLQ